MQVGRVVQNGAMDVLVSGSHGLIGSALIDHLRRNGHSVRRLVRGPVTGRDVSWDIPSGALDPAELEGVDAVVHLAGEGIGEHRWSDAQKRRILESRTVGTRLLSETLAAMTVKPSVMVSGSAVGFYGDRGDEELCDESTGGVGFLADVVREWEGATGAAAAAGVRVVHARTGIVLSPLGGALKKQLLPFKLGLGGRLGLGMQWTSWISIDDEVAAILHCLTTETLQGAVNLTAPRPVTNAEFAKALGSALHRPAFMPIPGFALKALFGGEMATEMLLSGQRVLPRRLESSGYTFVHSEIRIALGALLS